LGLETLRRAAILHDRLRVALRDSRTTSVRAAQAMMDRVEALVSGVLIGISEALQPGTESISGGGRSPKK